ncbi:hypothetical protein LXA43DRAFT_1103987 [Ganoderma leucocontextum]|nr:hypothetical protein LXA43DRAFT_1103987 [Ganoderma leucocontextum]
MPRTLPIYTGPGNILMLRALPSHFYECLQAKRRSRRRGRYQPSPLGLHSTTPESLASAVANDIPFPNNASLLPAASDISPQYFLPHPLPLPGYVEARAVRPAHSRLGVNSTTGAAEHSVTASDMPSQSFLHYLVPSSCDLDGRIMQSVSSVGLHSTAEAAASSPQTQTHSVPLSGHFHVPTAPIHSGTASCRRSSDPNFRSSLQESNSSQRPNDIPWEQIIRQLEENQRILEDSFWKVTTLLVETFHMLSRPQTRDAKLIAEAPVAVSCPVPGRSGTHATVPNMDEAAWVTVRFLAPSSPQEVPVSDAIIRTQSVFTGRSDSTAQPTLESSHYTLEPGRPYIERTYSASSLLRGLDDPFNSWPYSGEGCLTHWHRYSPPIHHETTVSSPSTPEYSQVAAPIPTYADSDLYYGSAEAMSGQGHVQGIYTHSPPSAASASVGSIASSPHFTPTLSALGATENFQLLYPEVDIDVYEGMSEHQPTHPRGTDTSRSVMNGPDHPVSDGEPFFEDDMDLSDEGWLEDGLPAMDVPHRHTPVDDGGAPVPSFVPELTAECVRADNEVRVDVGAGPLDGPTAVAELGPGDFQGANVDNCLEHETSSGRPKRPRNRTAATSKEVPLRRSMRLQLKTKLTSPPAPPKETGLRRSQRLQEKARDCRVNSGRKPLAATNRRRRAAGIPRGVRK